MTTNPESQPSSNPEETTQAEAELPGFRQPRRARRQPTQDPMDPEATTILETPTPADPEAGEGLGDELGGLPPLSSTMGATGPSRLSTADPKAFESVIGTGVQLASLGLHARLTPGDNPLWLADEDDVDAISKPLSRIIARHSPVKDNEAASDLADGLEAGVATVGYVVKNVTATAQARAAWGQQADQNRPIVDEAEMAR